MLKRISFIYSTILFLLCVSVADAQNNLIAVSSNTAEKVSALNSNFKKYEIVTVNPTKLAAQFRETNDYQTIHLKLGDYFDEDVQVVRNKLFTENYVAKALTAKGEVILGAPTCVPMSGFVVSNPSHKVSLTIDNNFIYGFVQTNSGEIFFEPTYDFIEQSPQNQFVVYNTNDVVPNSTKKCGVTEANEFIDKHANGNAETPSACYDLELAIASDYSMYTKYTNSTVNVANHNAGIINNVNVNYTNQFTHNINFAIVTQYFITTAGGDPWSSSTDAGTLLGSFRTWGQSNGFGSGVLFDLGELWTNRDFDGATVGLAYVGVVCTGVKYHILQDFTNTGAQLRCMTAHEIGHNFNIGHDDQGSLIMAPFVSAAVDFSQMSKDQCNPYIQQLLSQGTCLSPCSAGGGNPPNSDFATSYTNICSGSTLQFYDNSTGGQATGWNWTFAGGTPATSTEQYPKVTFNTPGTYTITMTASNATGNSSKTKTDYIVVGNGSGTKVLLDETFEGNTSSWGVINPDNSNTWQIFSGVGGSYPGKRSGGMDNYNYTAIGQRDQFLSPTFNMTGISFPTLKFDHAYRQSGTDVDSLLVKVSIDGGMTFPFVVFRKGGAQLATLDTSSLVFVPSQVNQWCGQPNYAICNTIDMSQFIGQANVRISFENYNGYGNNLWIDNVRVAASCSTVPTTQAAFTANITQGCVGQVIQFTDQSTSNPTAWQWSFPGGSPSTSILRNPIITYNSPGVYPVTLTAVNGGGSNTILKNGYINITPTPYAFFIQSSVQKTTTFSNNSIDATSYLWDFGDGQTSTLTNPVHTYATSGNYTVVLTAINICGSTTYTRVVGVFVKPIATFTNTNSVGCLPLSVTFTSTSTENPTGYFWFFPGGSPNTSSSALPVTVSYAFAGTYTVTLVAVNQSGRDTIIKTNLVVVSGPPITNFTYTRNIRTITCNNTSTNAVSYAWNFGDGGTSTLQNPSHTYAVDGVYTVTLVSTNLCGTSTQSTTITVNSKPVADFGVDHTIDCEVFNGFNFNQLASSNTQSLKWLFPGGSITTSTDPNPSLSYPTVGSFDVTLIATNASGSDTLKRIGYINIKPTTTSDFTSSVNGSIATFTNTSKFGQTYLWDFGDATSSTATNPVHTYATGGTFNVKLTTTGVCGGTPVIITKQVTVLGGPAAAFTSNVTSGCASFGVQYTNQSPSATSYYWSFPGGTPDASIDPNPLVNYATAGTYGVTLTVANTNGSNTLTKPNLITANAKPTPSISNISNQCSDATAVTLSGAPIGGSFSGTGVTGSSFNPSTAGAGTFFVTYSLTSNGCTGTATTSVIVNAKPVATITNPGSLCNNGAAINLVGNPTGGTFSGTGITGSSFSPTSAGTFLVNYSVTNAGCTGTSALSVVVNATPNPSIVNVAALCNNGPAVALSATPSGGTFSGTGVTGSSFNPTTAGAGNFVVNYSVTNNGCTGTSSSSIVVNAKPAAAFNATPSGKTITLSNNSTGTSNTYLWSFGDNTTDVTATPTKTYAADGTYSIKLVVSNACGKDSITKIVNISSQLTAGFTVADTLCVGAATTLTNTSSANATTYAWTLTGSTTPTSSVKDPSVLYNAVGNYTISLVASNANFTNTITKSIVVIDKPVVDINGTTGVNKTITFTTTSIGNSYLWDFGDGTTSTLKNPIKTYTTNGDYTVKLTVTNRCGNNFITKLFKLTAVNDIKDINTINIYPNPNTGLFDLVLTGNPIKEKLQMSILNIVGQEVYSDKLDFSAGILNSKINLINIAAGSYILKLKSGTEILTRKIVIQK
jgi:PKD repeat protein